MILLDDNNKPIDSVEVYLTLEEAEEFLGRLISNNEMPDDYLEAGNVFGTDDGFDVESGYLEFGVYTPDNINQFPKTLIDLIIKEYENNKS
jgi:hypothetical protein